MCIKYTLEILVLDITTLFNWLEHCANNMKVTNSSIYHKYF